jgi:RNA polymerase sigma-70 factor (ECF subfamily)
VDIRLPGASAPESFRRQLLHALPRLRRYARAVLLDNADADALTGITLDRALGNWHFFDQRHDVRVWLLSIARQARQDLQRGAAPATGSSAGLAGDALAGTACQPNGRQPDLLTALTRLDPDQREVLLLASVEQLSYAECGRILQISPAKVADRLALARIALRGALDSHTGQQERQPRLRRIV